MDFGFKIISKFFKENPNFLVDHHLESYNRFVNHDIHQLIKQNNPISFNKNLMKVDDEDMAVHSCDIYIGGKDGDLIRFAKPILVENDEQNYLNHSNFSFPKGILIYFSNLDHNYNQEE